MCLFPNNSINAKNNAKDLQTWYVMFLYFWAVVLCKLPACLYLIFHELCEMLFLKLHEHEKQTEQS